MTMFADVLPPDGTGGDPLVTNIVGNVDYSFMLTSFGDLSESISDATRPIFGAVFVVACGLLVFFLCRFALRYLRRALRPL